MRPEHEYAGDIELDVPQQSTTDPTWMSITLTLVVFGAMLSLCKLLGL